MSGFTCVSMDYKIFTTLSNPFARNPLRKPVNEYELNMMANKLTTLSEMSPRKLLIVLF